VKVHWRKYRLRFRFDAGTSRGILRNKVSYFVFIEDNSGVTGIGECSLLPGLSFDDRPDYEKKLSGICHSLKLQEINDYDSLLIFFEEHLAQDWPSIRMGIETAFLDRMNGGGRKVFVNNFMKGEPIPINGLIWMGDKRFMLEQVKEKIDSGYNCIKIKIGAIDFDTELEVLRYVRSQMTERDITLRVDANGAFNMKNVMEKLSRLEKLKIHSIEQPIKAGQWESMQKLCECSPIPVGLDEELIGAYTYNQKKEMINYIRPQFIILKPSPLGGFAATDEWIEIAGLNDVGWWITSALESNIGLNAICQYTYGLGVKMEQGLGTGTLFHNNFNSPLKVSNGNIKYAGDHKWDLSGLQI
jgi:L-alanine-DL-glutamate epimerase-like enolase superfamily enzyme